MARRGPSSSPFLRRTSAASLDTRFHQSAEIAHSDVTQMADDRYIHPSVAAAVKRSCTLWVHDDAFSREEILFNPAAFGETSFRAGDIIEILPMAAFSNTSHASLKSELGPRPGRDSTTESQSSSSSGNASKFKTPVQARCLFVAKPLPEEIGLRHPKLEISVTSSIAAIFGFKNRSQALVAGVDIAQCSASHVELSFRDQFLVRSDMWRLVTSELVDKVIYKGQKISFMGSIKATVKNIFIRGKKVLSGYFSPHTIPVFRSESAKYVLFIQMSREMWDFDAEGTGDILFSRVINGFLPELFKRWANIDAKHLVTIVLFTRVEYDAPGSLGVSALNTENLKNINNPNFVPSRDFYRVVVNDMSSGHWTTILDELKKDFRTFLRDVSTLKLNDAGVPTFNEPDTNADNITATIAGRPSTAIRGNILEAIHLASAHLSFDHIDRDMVHTATSIVVITPGSGVFEVPYESLATTTEALTNRGIAIDLVCLSPMPLHSVPLFKFPGPAQRPPSAVGGIFSSTSGSPELHQSPTASSTRRLSQLSAPSDLYENPQSSKLREHLRKPEGWNYGIPHWLDISYWNPDTYREARRLQKKDPNAPIPWTITKKSKLFVPRVRMYEIQMMGVMESEQSNISIPYISEGRGIPNEPAVGFGQASRPSRLQKSSFKSVTFSKSQLSDSLRPEPFLQIHSPPKDGAMAATRKSPRSALVWMDQYDSAVFHAFPKQKQGRKQTKTKRLSEPDIQKSIAHDRISARSISTLIEHEDQLHGRSQPTVTAADAPSPAPKSPLPSKNITPPKPALKPVPAPQRSRISRTISFALRGLGPVAPRAQASTEVNAEHARALPIKNHVTSNDVPSDARSVHSLSLSEADSASTVISRPNTPLRSVTDSDITPSRPITIKTPSKGSARDAIPPEGNRIGESIPKVTEDRQFDGEHSTTENHTPRTGVRFGGEKPVSANTRDSSSRNLASKALAPWVRSVNPCNTPKAVIRDASWFGRWQHAYPRPPHVALVKWKSLKSPAVLPLTTEEFPTTDELASDYLQTPYRVFPNDDAEGLEAPKTRDGLLREMISLRLSHGFQIVVGKNVAEVSGQYSLESMNVFDGHGLEKDGATLFLSKGNTIHRLVCVNGGEIEVTRYTHRSSAAYLAEKTNDFTMYRPAMRTILNPHYEIKNIRMETATEEYNWNYADNYIAGHRDYLMQPAQQLQFWRVRYVLIPLPLHGSSRHQLPSYSEDNDEEIHLLGISQLTHMWQRHKYVPPEEKRFESLSSRKRDLNPLNIMYQTRNPSEVVTAELDRILLSDPGLDNPPAQLLPESELLERSSISLSQLAQIIQGDKGVRMMDRKWHWRLHYNCFIGTEFTTWLLQNFRDIDTREEAVDFGNELFKHGLLQHVEKRHNFRDGNYFYQIAPEYRVSRPESRGGWFQQKRPDRSVPSTPSGERPRDSPRANHGRNGSAEIYPLPLLDTPTKSKNKVAIMLSKSMKYDVDPRKRSDRPEVVDLHYDRLHNPENCFHIELSWMNTTPRLIEDTVISWASTAEKFGLKLVQVPIEEACAISKTQPFRKPYRVKLKVPPPKGPPASLYSTTSFVPAGAPDQHYFQKAILRKFDYVLDFEAQSSFPVDVEVSYSWGKPEYRYPQYIHRSGSLLVQISDEGDFLFLANRLVSTRSLASRDAPRHERKDRPDPVRPRAGTQDAGERASPRQSPAMRSVQDTSSPSNGQGSPNIDAANLYRAPEHYLSQLLDFCSDSAQLQQFYNESHARPVSTRVGPASALLLDASIPSLELPASLVGHHISPPPTLPSRISHDGAVGDKRPWSRDENPSSSKGSPCSGALRPLV